MVIRDTKTRTLTLQPDNASYPFDYNAASELIGNMCNILNRTMPNSPENDYLTTLTKQERHEHDNMIIAVADHFEHVCEQLRIRNLPVVIPDYKAFDDAYRYIKAHYTGEAFKNAIRNEVRWVEKTVKDSMAINNALARQYGIVTEKPRQDPTSVRIITK